MTREDFLVLHKWREAPAYAFGMVGQSGVVSPDEKEAYWRVYTDIISAAENARDEHPAASDLRLKKMGYSRERGSRGHRPKDLWASVCAVGAEVFEGKPQVYAIASHRGLEVGFAASISEDDYFDAASKERNRAVIPMINAKLPGPADPLTAKLDSALAATGHWHFNSKTRLTEGEPGFDAFGSAADLIAHLKASGDEAGGGVICRMFAIDEIEGVDVIQEFKTALGIFTPLLARCAPTTWDTAIRVAQQAVEQFSADQEVDPENEEDGRKKVLAEVARRQGQKAFRGRLIDAYGGACAITGTSVLDVLQAAHIRPYNGPSTNHVTNGLLLRADLHTLFDLKLVTVEPGTMTVCVSPLLADTPYASFHGSPLSLPSKPTLRPSGVALANHCATLKVPV